MSDLNKGTSGGGGGDKKTKNQLQLLRPRH